MSNRNLLNPLGIDPIGGFIGRGLGAISPVHNFLNKAIFGGGQQHSRLKAGPIQKSFRNFAESPNQSAYNAPDSTSRLSAPAGPRQQGGMPQMGYGGMGQNRGNPGVSPFQNAAATMGIANPSYGKAFTPRQPSGPQMRPGYGAFPFGGSMAPWL